MAFASGTSSNASLMCTMKAGPRGSSCLPPSQVSRRPAPCPSAWRPAGQLGEAPTSRPRTARAGGPRRKAPAVELGCQWPRRCASKLRCYPYLHDRWLGASSK
eukprot:65659-Pyramimonas_sp.AAC.1